MSAARRAINRTRGLHWHAANAVLASLPAGCLWWYLSGKRAESARASAAKKKEQLKGPPPLATPQLVSAATQTPAPAPTPKPVPTTKPKSKAKE